MIGIRDVRMPSAGYYRTVRTVKNIPLLSSRSKDNAPLTVTGTPRLSSPSYYGISVNRWKNVKEAA